MVEYWIPLTDIFREPALVLESFIIILGLEFGLYFLYRFIKKDREKKMILAWVFFFFAFAAMVAFFVISDYFSSIVDRQLFLNLGYGTMVIGALVFTFNAEREVEIKSHSFSLILVTLGFFLVIDFFLVLFNPLYIALACWGLFITFLLIYVMKVIKRIKEYKINILAFLGGFLVWGLGYTGTIDAMVGVFGTLSRLFGNIAIITGMCLISSVFVSIPSLREVDWAQKLDKLLLLHRSGMFIWEHDFQKHAEIETPKEMPAQQMAGSLIGISKLIMEIIQSKKRLKIMDHQDKQIIFSYGEHLIAALIADEYLEIYRRKLINLLDEVETLYWGILYKFDGKSAEFKQIGRIISNTFS